MADGVSSGCRTIGGARGAVVAVGVVAIAGAGRAGAIFTALLQRAKFEIEGIDFFVKIRGRVVVGGGGRNGGLGSWSRDVDRHCRE
jgi:hypothetical protein